MSWLPWWPADGRCQGMKAAVHGEGSTLPRTGPSILCLLHCQQLRMCKIRVTKRNQIHVALRERQPCTQPHVRQVTAGVTACRAPPASAALGTQHPLSLGCAARLPGMTLAPPAPRHLAATPARCRTPLKPPAPAAHSQPRLQVEGRAAVEQWACAGRPPEPAVGSCSGGG